MDKLFKSAVSFFIRIALILGFSPSFALADPASEKQENQAVSASLDSASSQNEGIDDKASDQNAEAKSDMVDEPDKQVDQTVIRSQDAQEEATKNQTRQSSSDAAIEQLAAKNKSVLPDGEYVIQSALHNNLVVDVQWGSRNNGAPVQTYSFNNTNAQKWKVTHDKDGFLILTNIGSGRVLDVSGGIARNNAKTQQWNSNNTRAQRWIAVKTKDGYINLVSALDRNLVLDITSGSKQVKTRLQIHSSNGSNAQKFAFRNLHPSISSGEKVIEDGYYIVSSSNSSFVWDIKDGSLSNGANAQLWSANSSAAQIFKFTYINGCYRIEAGTGKSLEVVDESVLPGASVRQNQFKGSAGQLWVAKDNGDGSFTFINKRNGLALDIAGGKAAKTSNLQCYTANGGQAQKFKLTKCTNFLKNGTFVLRSSLNNQKAIDVKSGSRSEGANVQIHSNNGTQAQKWNVQLVEGQANTYTLRSIVSGRLLTMDANGNVCQRQQNNSASQQWQVSVQGGGYVFTNVKYGKALDIKGGQTANGTNIQGHRVNGTAAQRFSLVGSSLLNNGTYFVQSAGNGSQVLDVKWGSKDNNANIQTHKNNNSGAQKWKISQNSDGTYKIVNAQSNKALDIASGKAVDGANVQQTTSNSNVTQKWHLINNNDGTFKFASAANKSLVLSVNGNLLSDANVCVQNDRNAINQRFTFSSTNYSPMPAAQQAMLNKAQGYSSGSGYLILVNRATHKVGVFKGAKGRWTYQNYWSCVTGAPWSQTITGVFQTTGFKRLNLTTDYRARFCTQIKGGYFFHSILVSDNELGQSLSHGCIRLRFLARNGSITILDEGQRLLSTIKFVNLNFQ